MCVCMYLFWMPSLCLPCAYTAELCMYVCMSMYVCMYVFVLKALFMPPCAHTSELCMYVCMYVFILHGFLVHILQNCVYMLCVYVYVCICFSGALHASLVHTLRNCMCACTCVCMYVCMYVYKYIAGLLFSNKTSSLIYGKYVCMHVCMYIHEFD